MNKLLHPTKRCTIATSIFFVLFVSIVLPLVSSFTTTLIGVSESPDTGFFYSVSSLLELMEQYGENGRRVYIIMRWTFDVVWPLVYTLFFVVTISYFITNISLSKYWLIAPLLGVVFDFLENTLLTIHMAIYPNELTLLLHITPFITLFKWIAIFVTFGVQLYLLFILITKKRHS